MGCSLCIPVLGETTALTDVGPASAARLLLLQRALARKKLQGGSRVKSSCQLGCPRNCRRGCRDGSAAEQPAHGAFLSFGCSSECRPGLRSCVGGQLGADFVAKVFGAGPRANAKVRDSAQAPLANAYCRATATKTFHDMAEGSLRSRLVLQCSFHTRDAAQLKSQRSIAALTDCFGAHAGGRMRSFAEPVRSKN